jgi:hypothetical protein
MSVFKPQYAADAALTITSMASLAAGAAAASAYRDNTADLYEEALVSVAVATGGAVDGAASCAVYAYGSTDGSHYTDGVSGADGHPTLSAPTNLRLIGVVSTPLASTTYRAGPFSVASAFGDVLPPRWGIVVVNNQATNALAASGSSADFVGVNGQA